MAYLVAMFTACHVCLGHNCTCVCCVFFHRAREFAPTEDEKWVAEFEEQMRSSDGRDLQSVARDMTQVVTDPDIQASEVS